MEVTMVVTLRPETAPAYRLLSCKEGAQAGSGSGELHSRWSSSTNQKHSSVVGQEAEAPAGPSLLVMDQRRGWVPAMPAGGNLGHLAWRRSIVP